MAKISSDRMKKLVTLILITVGLALFLNQFFFAPKKKKAEIEKLRQGELQKQTSKEDIFPIKVMDVIRHDYVDILDALGTMKGGVEFKLTFQIPGIIESINYREGEKYKKGALLISLAEEDIVLRMQRVESQMKKTQTAVELVVQKLEEHEKLFKMGAISKTTLDKVRLELESSEYDLEGAKLEVKANEAILEKANLYAVSDGMIGELYVEEGEVVTANTLIGNHILTEYVRAEFGVIERDMNKIREGQDASVYVDAYPGQRFSGVVDSIAPVVGGASRTATVSVKLSNKEGLLLPGMFARIQVDLYQKRNALVIPTEAILTDEAGETFVFVLNEEEMTVSQTSIQIGYTRSDYSQIDKGIKEGQPIAITSIDRLKDGVKVDVVEKQTLEL